MEGNHNEVRPQWAIDHGFVFLQNILIAGVPFFNSGTQQEMIIDPISLPEMWKDRGNTFVREKNDYESGKEWYNRAIDFLILEIGEGRLKSMWIEVDRKRDGFIQILYQSLHIWNQQSSVNKQEITETDEFLAVLYSNLSFCYLKTKDGKKALELAKKSVKHNPKFVRAYLRMV